MKTKNVWMPILAFVVAIGMAFATTPINEFTTEVWMKVDEEDTGCHVTICTTTPGPPCNQTGLFYDDEKCDNSISNVYARPN